MPGEYTFYAGSDLLEPLASRLGVTTDKMNFVAAAAVSVPIAVFYSTCLGPGMASRSTRLAFPLFVALAVCYFCYGTAIKHLLFNTGVCYALIRFGPGQHAHKLVFAVSVGYLSFIHWYRWWFLKEMVLYVDVTGPMMLVTQRLTSLAFSLHDGLCKNEEELTPIQRREAVRRRPTLLEFCSYMFNFQTVQSGPLCFYKDYMAFIGGNHYDVENQTPAPTNGKLGRNEGSSSRFPSPWLAVFGKITLSLLFMVLVMCFHKEANMNQLLEEPLKSAGLFQFYYFVLWSQFIQRAHYYFAWVLADAICNASGFGFNGYSEHGRPKWNLLSNVDIWKFETADSWKEALDSWNCTTMAWLRRVAYERAPKRYRTAYTYLLSAWWHGFFPGYYLTFPTGALFTVAARKARHCLRPRALEMGPTWKFAYDVLTFIATKLAMAYCTFPFILLVWQPSLVFYCRFYFHLHIAAVALIVVLPQLLPPRKPNSTENGPSTLCPGKKLE